jgi:triosephosphate isomerase (TIM)
MSKSTAAGLVGVSASEVANMRIRMIAGNWKMNEVRGTARAFFERFRPLVGSSRNCEIVIFPSFLELDAAVISARGTKIQIGAQNLSWAREGAFTGEVSGLMLRASGCSHVIVGHSERRKYFGETNASVLKKTLAAIDAGLTPIVCVGECEKKNVETVLAEQFAHSISMLLGAQFAKIVIAYEPVWAIGTGQTAAPEAAAAAHRFIRAQVTASFGAEAANNVRILYGGSVNPDNAKSLMAQPEVDGLLVGGASLDPVSFASIVNL